MAAPTDKMLVYDGNCPLCDWYTGVFAQHDILKPEHRRTFAMFADSELRTMMEFPRARHEIPLVDLNGGPTLYGVEAITYLLGHRFPVIRHLMQYRFIAGAAHIAYAFVSYNRRFIAFSRPAPCSVDYTPDYNRTYRLLFIALCALISLVVSLPCMPAFPGSGKGLLYPVVVTAVSTALVYMIDPGHFREYISHLSVVVMLGSLASGIGGALALIFGAPVLAGVGAVCGAIITTWLYNVRIRRMGMSVVWSVLWGVLVLLGAVFVGGIV